ncbi:MAG: type IV pilus biogenesis/stability protein PilW [Betaproteobacteria bacterium]
MIRAVVIILIASLAGCASQKSGNAPVAITPPPAERPQTPTSGLERAKIHTELGVSYYQNSQLEIALDELRTAINADRTYAPAYDALGLVYMQLKQDAPAEQSFRQSLKLNPNSSETKNNYGLFLCQRGRETEGIKQLMAALKNPLYSTPDVAYKNAGVCARKAGDDKTAETYLLKSIAINPRQAQALYGLADLHYAHSDYVGANRYIGRYFSAVENAGPDALWLGAKISHKLVDRTAFANYGMQLRRRYPASTEAKAFAEGRFE